MSSGKTEARQLNIRNQVISVMTEANLIEPKGGSEEIDFSVGNLIVTDLGDALSDVTFDILNIWAGGVYAIKVIQGATARGITWPVSFLWADGDTYVPSTVDDTIDLVSFVYDGTNCLASYRKAYA